MGFSTPKEVWTHYVLTYRTLGDPDSIYVFVNGEVVTNFAFKSCSDGIFAEENSTRMSIGEHAHGGKLPEASFDEVIIWYRNVTREDINTFYSYYKGKVLTVPGGGGGRKLLCERRGDTCRLPQEPITIRLSI